jgi:ribosomal protein S12 methylthiotransferase
MTKVGFMSLGCPKNLVDSEVMLGHLRLRGYEITARLEEAEVLVVNTCGFIEPSKKESIEAILEAAAMKTAGACRRLVVAGCLVERYREQLMAEIPEIDACLGTRDIEQVAEVIGAEGLFHLDPNPSYLYDEHSPRLLSAGGASAYLKISEGCDHACAFCAIPAIRGPQRSRTVDSILAEARNLVAQGILELNLVGQDTTDFGTDLGEPGALARLVRALGRVEGLAWFRIHYSYPNRITEDLVRAMAETETCVKYLDMPLQHADPRVLRTMARGGGGATYLKLIHRIRRQIPGIFLRSNFIVGFPGETPEAFQHLLDFVAEAAFEHVGVFTYSAEEGTPAFTLGDPIPERTKQARKRKVLEVQQRISRAKNRALVGRTLDVLVEGTHAESDQIYRGRHAGQAPEVDGDVLIVGGEPKVGTIQPVRITEGHAYDLVGEIEEGGAEAAIQRFERGYRAKPRG